MYLIAHFDSTIIMSLSTPINFTTSITAPFVFKTFSQLFGFHIFQLLQLWILDCHYSGVCYFAPGVLRQFLAMVKQHRMENPGIFFHFPMPLAIIIRALRVSSSKLSWVPYFQLSMHTLHNISFCKSSTSVLYLPKFQFLSQGGKDERHVIRW